jgi:hypothetical protein
MVEEIITALSKLRWFFVIARNSSFTYKGRATDVKQVGRELGVRYVLEGSVRKSANRARITAQLIDAAIGSHIWAERYDRELADIFAVQDEITERVVGRSNRSFILRSASVASASLPKASMLGSALSERCHASPRVRSQGTTGPKLSAGGRLRSARATARPTACFPGCCCAELIGRGMLRASSPRRKRGLGWRSISTSRTRGRI